MTCWTARRVVHRLPNGAAIEAPCVLASHPPSPHGRRSVILKRALDTFGLVLDEATPFGSRAATRLREDRLAWLTTVDGRGTPQPVPVWFLWDGAGSILVYSRPDTPKLRNIEANPRVSLHLDGDGLGGDIVVCLGAAHISDDHPADRVPAYVDKYSGLIARNGWTAASFAADYSVPLRIAIARIRGH